MASTPTARQHQMASPKIANSPSGATSPLSASLTAPSSPQMGQRSPRSPQSPSPLSSPSPSSRALPPTSTSSLPISRQTSGGPGGQLSSRQQAIQQLKESVARQSGFGRMVQYSLECLTKMAVDTTSIADIISSGLFEVMKEAMKKHSNNAKLQHQWLHFLSICSRNPDFASLLAGQLNNDFTFVVGNASNKAFDGLHEMTQARLQLIIKMGTVASIVQHMSEGGIVGMLVKQMQSLQAEPKPFLSLMTLATQALNVFTGTHSAAYTAHSTDIAVLVRSGIVSSIVGELSKYSMDESFAVAVTTLVASFVSYGGVVAAEYLKKPTLNTVDALISVLNMYTSNETITLRVGESLQKLTTQNELDNTLKILTSNKYSSTDPKLCSALGTLSGLLLVEKNVPILLEKHGVKWLISILQDTHKAHTAESLGITSGIVTHAIKCMERIASSSSAGAMSLIQANAIQLLTSFVVSQSSSYQQYKGTIDEVSMQSLCKILNTAISMSKSAGSDDQSKQLIVLIAQHLQQSKIVPAALALLKNYSATVHGGGQGAGVNGGISLAAVAPIIRMLNSAIEYSYFNPHLETSTVIPAVLNFIRDVYLEDEKEEDEGHRSLVKEVKKGAVQLLMAVDWNDSSEQDLKDFDHILCPILQDDDDPFVVGQHLQNLKKMSDRFPKLMGSLGSLSGILASKENDDDPIVSKTSSAILQRIQSPLPPETTKGVAASVADASKQEPIRKVSEKKERISISLPPAVSAAVVSNVVPTAEVQIAPVMKVINIEDDWEASQSRIRDNIAKAKKAAEEKKRQAEADRLRELQKREEEMLLLMKRARELEKEAADAEAARVAQMMLQDDNEKNRIQRLQIEEREAKLRLMKQINKKATISKPPLDSSAKRFLVTGVTLTKHSKTAPPRPRLVYITSDCRYLCWVESKTPPAKPPKDTRFRVDRLTSIAPGRASPQLQRKNLFGKYLAKEECCFSIKGRSDDETEILERTLDLEANSKDEFDAIYMHFEHLVSWGTFDPFRKYTLDEKVEVVKAASTEVRMLRSESGELFHNMKHGMGAHHAEVETSGNDADDAPPPPPDWEPEDELRR